MTTLRTLAAAALLGTLPVLAACAPQQEPPAAKRESDGVLGNAIRQAMSEAREEIAHGNISISSEQGQPKAEITAKGDLLIDGRAVDVSPEQRALLLEYRRHVAAIAESGMEIGVQGADVAATAVGEAFRGVFSGKSGEEIERTIEAEAAKIKQSAVALCGRLPAMLATQQKLAAALPEFRPYAKMTQADIDECLQETREPEGSAAQVAEAAPAPPADTR